MSNSNIKYLFDNEYLLKLIKGIAKRRKRSFEVFYNIYGRSIYLIAKSVCVTHENAEEVLNDVMVRVWNSAPALVVDNLSGWLYRITINAAIDKYRNFKLQRERFCGIEYDISDKKNYFQEVEDTLSFSAYIADLNETEQKIMICKFIYDMTFEQIAKVLKMPMGTITPKYYGILKKIKAKIEK